MYSESQLSGRGWVGAARFAAPIAALMVSGGVVAQERSSQLEARIEFSVPRATLQDAVKLLGEEVGTPLEVANGPLASRPVLLYLRNRSGRQAMDDLARFLATPPGKCVWTRTDSGRYLLQEDDQSRKARQNQTTLLRTQRARRLEQDIVTALRLGLLAGEELERERRRHPELAFASPELRPGLAILASLNPLQRSELLSGKPVITTVGQLPPAVQGSARAMLGGKLQQRITDPRLNGGYLEWRADRDLPNTPISIRISGQPDRPGVQVALSVLPGSRNGYGDLLHPAIPPDEARPPWLKDAIAQRERAELQEESEQDHQRRLAVLKKDPELTQRVSVAAQVEARSKDDPSQMQKYASDLSLALAQIADQTGISIIGDYDPCWDDYYTRMDPYNPNMRRKTWLKSSVKDVPVWQAMEMIRQVFRVEWDKQGDVLVVRSPRVPYALADGLDLIDPPLVPDLIAQLLKGRQPGERLPGVTYPEATQTVSPE